MAQKDWTYKEAASELHCRVAFIRAEVKRKRIYPVLKTNARVHRIPDPVFQAYKKNRMQ